MMSRLFLVAVFILVSGCYPPIEETCADIAATQCDICSGCDVDLTKACGLTSAADCVETLTARCENQSSTLQDPKSDVQVCSDALSNWTCGEALEAAAQGRGATVDACSYFL